MDQEATPLQLAFAEQVVRLNNRMEELFKSGNVALFKEMNGAVKEMYAIQHGSEDEVMQMVEPDCEVVYENFNAIVTVLRTTEDGVIDVAAQKAINKFLHNIDEALISIASALGII